MNLNKYLGIAILYVLIFTIFLSGCAVQDVAPLVDGDVYNLFPGFTKWLSTSGDAYVKMFLNPTTGISVFARPFEDGWAVVYGKGQNYAGYFMNNNTWNNLVAWMTSAAGGFGKAINLIGNLTTMPIFAMPVIPDATPLWQVIPGMGQGGID